MAWLSDARLRLLVLLKEACLRLRTAYFIIIIIFTVYIAGDGVVVSFAFVFFVKPPGSLENKQSTLHSLEKRDHRVFLVSGFWFLVSGFWLLFHQKWPFFTRNDPKKCVLTRNGY